MTEKRQRPKPLEGSSKHGDTRVSVGSSMTMWILKSSEITSVVLLKKMTSLQMKLLSKEGEGTHVIC